MRTSPFLLVFAAASVALANPALPTDAELRASSARLKPVDLEVPLAKLPDGEKAVLRKIIQAAQVLDGLYLRQVWAGNTSLLLALSEDSSAAGKTRLQAFLQNRGPWLRLEHDRPFIPGVAEKPKGGGFYPPNATKQELEAWFKSLPEAERKKATGFFTVIRRQPGGKLAAVPYSVEYQGELEQAAALLREAAQLTTQPTLKDYLGKRAAALLSDDYYESDVAWMKLEASIEPTVGPYEVYEDEWFNFKAAFEAFVTVRDDVETAKLAKFGDHLQDIENHLPIEPSLRNPKLGALAPIRVVNSLYGAGDANRGVQTAAFNLPNDERIAKEMGTKRVMLKNVQEAKFKSVLQPIAQVALAPADRKRVSFDAFFTHILMHELMHGLGPHEVVIEGKKSTVRAQLQELYSTLEEAKADVSGLFALQHLIDKGIIDRSMEQSMYTTFLASCFRSIRFGLNEAHGRGIALQLNYLLDAGAFQVAKDGTFSVDAAKVKGAVTVLSGELMTLQARGDKAKAQELLSRMVVIRPEVQRVLDRLSKVPVDIDPRFVTAERLLAEP